MYPTGVNLSGAKSWDVGQGQQSSPLLGDGSCWSAVGLEEICNIVHPVLHIVQLQSVVLWDDPPGCPSYSIMHIEEGSCCSRPGKWVVLHQWSYLSICRAAPIIHLDPGILTILGDQIVLAKKLFAPFPSHNPRTSVSYQLASENWEEIWMLKIIFPEMKMSGFVPLLRGVWRICKSRALSELLFTVHQRLQAPIASSKCFKVVAALRSRKQNSVQSSTQIIVISVLIPWCKRCRLSTKWSDFLRS